MTIEQESVVDFISVNEERGYVCLTISDHLEWDEKNEKLRLLQSKINLYLAFIESGQLIEAYPVVAELRRVIRLVSLEEPNSEGARFLEMIVPIIKESDIDFEWEVSIAGQ